MCAVSDLVTQTVARREGGREGEVESACILAVLWQRATPPPGCGCRLQSTLPVSCWSSAVTCGAMARAGHSDRDNLAAWLVQVCHQEEAQPHVFCLAVSMMDRVLARLEVSQPQLPLLASSCLLLSWKIRQHKPISASRIVKYSQASFLLEELLVRSLHILLTF